MYLNSFGNKSFKLSIISTLILLQNLGRCLAHRHITDDELVIPHQEEEGAEDNNNCQKKILELKNELDSLKEDVKLYKEFKEFQLEAFYFVNERIDIIIKTITLEEDRQEIVVKKQMDFLQDHILDDSLLKQISQRILSSLLENLNMNTTSSNILSTFPMVTLSSQDGRIQLELLEFLFDHLDSLGFLENLLNLEKMVNLMKKIFLQIKTTKAHHPSSSPPSSSASLLKEREVKLLHKLIVNLLSQNEGESLRVHDVGKWLNNQFFSSFLQLSEAEVYQVLLDTFETLFEDKLLTHEQLQYVKQLYYQSFLPSSSNPPNLRFVGSTFRATSATENEWRQRKEVFSRPLIFNSIDRDILSKVTANQTDGPTIGLHYLENELLDLDSIWSYNDFDENDIWFCRVVDVLLHAMQNGTPLTYNPNEADYWKLIQYFGNAKSVLVKYPFLVDDVKSFIFDTYDHKRQNLVLVFKFLQTVPRSFVLDGVRQLLSLMREDGHLHDGQEVFQLADFMMTSNLQNQFIWNELPEQVQLLCDYSRDKGLLWFFKSTAIPSPPPPVSSQADDDEETQSSSSPSSSLGGIGEGTSYEIFADDDFSIVLKPLLTAVHSDPSMGNDEQQLLTENYAKRIWMFDTTFVPSVNQARTQISLAETSSSHGGVVVAGQDEKGDRILRHVKNFRDRRHGKFATFQPILSNHGETFQLQLHHGHSADHVSVLYSAEQGQATVLVLKNNVDPLSPPAEFFVQREQ